MNSTLEKKPTKIETILKVSYYTEFGEYEKNIPASELREFNKKYKVKSVEEIKSPFTREMAKEMTKSNNFNDIIDKIYDYFEWLNNKI
jgi:hypothetical protein